MNAKSVLFGAAMAVAVSAGSVHAGENFKTLGAIPAAQMTAKQTEAVRGADHVLRLVKFRTGQDLSHQSAIDATTAAGSKSGTMGVGQAQDRPKIVGLLP